MEKKTTNKLRLGIFVSASFILFIAGLYFISKKQQLFNSTFIISGIFKDITGLQVGNNVRFSGINVGVIEDIRQITDSTVQVDMLINENTRKFIKKNAKAIISSDGLMGNKIVLIISGKPNAMVVSDNFIIGTEQLVSVDDILSQVNIVAGNAANITADLSIVMKNIREGKGTIGKLFMDSTFAQNVDEAFINIKQGAGGFKQNMDAAGHNVLLRGFIKKKEKKEKEAK
jgi:phospholipid/cholesterol/gamma-HCH transport system substrate-binding protein